MATSNSRDFALDASDVIEEAFERIGLEVRTGYQARTARRSMNIMFQDWSNRGINLWTVVQESTTMVQGTAQYVMNAYDIDIVDAVIRRDGNDYVLDRMSRGDYLSVPNKTTQGRPTQIYVERTSTPTFTVWPTPDNSTDTVVTHRVQRIQDIDALTNDTDVPSRFIPAMVSGLAFYMAVKLAPEKAQMLEQMYEADFLRASNEDSEHGSWRITPSAESYR